MSDTELRHVLEEIIRDIDEGRLAPRRGPLARLGAVVAGPMVAASLFIAGCEESQAAYAGPPIDGAVQQDVSQVDGNPVIEYAAPDAAVDSGPVVEYGYLDGTVDASPVVDYGAPPDGG